MTEPTIAADDMDAILDDALDELDDSDSDSDDNDDNYDHDTNFNHGGLQKISGIGSEKQNASQAVALPPAEKNLRKENRRVPMGPPRPPPDTSSGTTTTNSTRNPNKHDSDTLSEFNEQEMEESLRRMFKDLAAVEASLPRPESPRASDETRTKQEKASATTASKPREQETDTSPQNTTNDAVADDEKMMRDLFRGLMSAGGKDGSPGFSPDDAEEIPDLDKLFAGLEGDGAGGMDFDTDDFMDGMMEQLLSKDLMYEPMKQISEKFPGWLQAKKGQLAPDEWDRRNRQCECFHKIVEAYEGDESEQEASKLVELMQEVQEYGQPPLEMINEIAPGLDLDKEGLPNMTGIPPFLGGNPEDCRIM